MNGFLSSLVKHRPQWTGTVLLATLACAAWSGRVAPQAPSVEADGQRIRNAYGQLPLSFEANLGQTDPRVRYLSRGQGYSLFLTPSEAVLRVQRTAPEAKETPPPSTVVRMKLVGANADAASQGETPLPGRVNYLLGDDPAKWRRNVPLFSRVAFPSVYPGIDVAYYGNQGKLEYDFVVAPGADPSPIRLQFEGTQRIEVEPGGDLILHTALGSIRQQKPVIYQDLDAGRASVDGRYVCLSDTEVGFEVAAYDPKHTLVIDPILEYSSYLGGGDSDEAFGIALDGARNAYVIGTSASANYPVTPGAHDTTLATFGDVFVTKLNPTGTAILYSTFIGGSGFDAGRAIAVDTAGGAYVTGSTSSDNFPNVNALQVGRLGLYDAFVARISPAGDSLDFSTYFGGTSSEEGRGIGLDGTGSIYVSGATNSNNLPVTVGAYDEGYNAGDDAFVLKMAPDGSAYNYVTYLGGQGNDVNNGLAVDAAGNAYLIGATNSQDFPTASAYQAGNAGQTDAFVTKVHPSGQSLVFSTYLGGQSSDMGYDIEVDAAGNVYVVGEAGSANFPISPNAYDITRGGISDAFVTKFNPSGLTLAFSTYFGGNSFETGRSLGVDGNGNVWLSGDTWSRDMHTRNPHQALFGGGIDCFVTKLNATGTAITYSTYLGGGGLGRETGHALEVDANGDAYVAGVTVSTNWPVVNPVTGPNEYFGAFYRGGPKDAFVCKISDPPSPPRAPTGLTATAVGISQISLNWRDGSNNEDVFQIERRTEGTTFGLIATVESNIVTFLDTLLASNTKYIYRVRAVNQFGVSAYSSDAEAKTFPNPPQSPTDFSVSTLSPSELLLFWVDQATNETEYEIVRRTELTDYVPVGTAPANSTTFIDSNLAPATAYIYQVRAVNADGASDPVTAVGSTLPMRPSAPSELKAIATSSTQVALSWKDNANNETGFKVERRFGLGRFLQIASLSANQLTFTDDLAPANTAVTYRVRAFNPGGDSEYSEEASATTPPNPPGAPASLTATAVSQGRIDLNWTDVSQDETGFRVERRVGSNPFTLLVEVGANQTSHSDLTVEPNNSYTYRVVALNVGGTSPFSNEASVATPPNPPLAPTDLIATVLSSTQVNLAWTDNSDIETGYVVERRVEDGSFLEIETLGASSTTFTDTGLSAETTYSYRVKAVGLGGPSSYTETQTVTTTALPPGTPQGLRVAFASGSLVKLTWTDQSSNETHFSIERRSATVPFAVVGTVGANVTEYHDSGVSPLETYIYRIRAFNAGGNSEYSNLASTTTPPTVPAAPGNLTVAVASGSSVRLNWSDNSLNETHFKIERKQGDGIFVLLRELGSGVTTFVDSSLTPNTSFTYRVKARNAGGDSAPSNEAGIALPSGGRIRLQPARVNFGPAKVGTERTRTLKITNVGFGPLAVSVGSLTGVFRVTEGGGAFQLAAGESHTVTLVFEPTVPGAQRASLAITSSDAKKGSLTAILTGKGRR